MWFFLALGLAGQREAAVGGGSHGDVVEFFFKFGMAEEKAEGRPEVVQLFGLDALDLRIALGVEPCVFAVEEEELAGGRGVVPAHAAGLLKEKGAALGAVNPET